MEISLLLTLQAIINDFCEKQGITKMWKFAELAGIDRETVRFIYSKPAPYCPTWAAVCAIAVACDMRPATVKKDLRPLYNHAYVHSVRQTSHRHRAITASKEPTQDARVRDIAKQETAKLRPVSRHPAKVT